MEEANSVLFPIVVVTVVTVTPTEAALVHSPVAVAVAVTTCPAVNAVNPVFVQALLVTVVVPTDPASTNTSIIDPFASVLVPLTEVDPAQIGEVTTGAADALCTVTVMEFDVTVVGEAHGSFEVITQLTTSLLTSEVVV